MQSLGQGSVDIQQTEILKLGLLTKIKQGLYPISNTLLPWLPGPWGSLRRENQGREEQDDPTFGEPSGKRREPW